jgi:hypothetical protein
LELLELDQNVLRNQVRPRRHDLTELHEGRPEVLQDLPKPNPGRHSPGIAALAARNQGAQPCSVDDLAKAVHHEDARDLPKAL